MALRCQPPGGHLASRLGPFPAVSEHPSYHRPPPHPGWGPTHTLRRHRPAARAAPDALAADRRTAPLEPPPSTGSSRPRIGDAGGHDGEQMLAARSHDREQTIGSGSSHLVHTMGSRVSPTSRLSPVVPLEDATAHEVASMGSATRSHAVVLRSAANGPAATF